MKESTEEKIKESAVHSHRLEIILPSDHPNMSNQLTSQQHEMIGGKRAGFVGPCLLYLLCFGFGIRVGMKQKMEKSCVVLHE